MRRLKKNQMKNYIRIKRKIISDSNKICLNDIRREKKFAFIFSNRDIWITHFECWHHEISFVGVR